jgi:hypothetical protein
MSYRNDHDAALARIDALEAELAALQSATPEPEIAKPRRGVPWLTLGVALSATIAVGTMFGVFEFNQGINRGREQAVATLTLAPVAPSTRSYDGCRAQITHPLGLSAGSTDPRGSAHDVHAIVHTEAPCRLELQHSTDPAIRRWSRAENELAGDISRIVVYYEHDPYTLDGYTTAGQLWKEYDAAIVERDAALARLTPNS